MGSEFFPPANRTAMNLAKSHLTEIFRMKYGDPAAAGPSPRRRFRVGYFTPDDVYECLVAQLVTERTAWLDVGGGRDVFPSNPGLAQILADRCAVLVGVDPSENLNENPFVHERAVTAIEDFESERTYDLATLRMVAEHITAPEAAVASLARLVRPGGKVVVYTVNRWSPVSVLAWLIPFHLHHPLKRVFWNTEERDTFPVAYRMNTRKDLAQLFRRGGFRECHFAYLDDCRTFYRFPLLNGMELSVWRLLKGMGLNYPENCLLGVYERLP
jgi:SAM-dependent methyltransferase